MPDKNPEMWGWATWLLALTSSFLGGLLSFLKAEASKQPLHIRIRDALVELATSSIVGLLVFMGLSGLGWDSGVCAAVAGTAAHFSARLLYYVSHYADAYFEHKHRHLHGDGGKHDDD